MVVKLIFLLLTVGCAVLADNANSKHDLDLQSAKAVKKTIQSEDGDVIDCIDIHKQPSLSHPALKNHRIQLKPSFAPARDITSEKLKGKNGKEEAEVRTPVTKQIWQKSGSCPEGTVPIIRRSQSNNTFIHTTTPAASNQTNLLHPGHSISVLITTGYAYLGAQADLGIFYPSVEQDDEYTFTHITLENGPEQVRAGWAVNPLVHKDRQTRFTVYWTTDAGQNTGCFDTACTGYVQVSSTIAAGGALDLDSNDLTWPPSSMSIYLVKDTNTNNWWVKNGGHDVGYFPASLFKGLNVHASSVQWGGDVLSSRIGGVHPHTATDMGNGQYPAPVFSAVIQKLRVLENSWELKYPENLSPYADEDTCYTYFHDTEQPDSDFFYGGPGLDPRCP